MHLAHATEADFPAIIDLANMAYRGSGEVKSWNHEIGILEGERLNDSLLRLELAAKPYTSLLVARDEVVGPILGTVWLEPRADAVWYLGLLTIRPDLQNRHIGRALLAASEDFVRSHGGRRIRMSVLHVRDTLIAWYERRGYAKTGEIEPFPYGDNRFGKPLRDDLHFLILAKNL